MTATSTLEVDPLRISVVVGAAPPVRCGIGDYTDLLAGALASHGVDVTVVTTGGVELEPASYRRIAPVLNWDVGQVIRLARLLARARPQVVHIQYPGVGYGRGRGITLLPLLLRLAGFRGVLAMTVHEFDLYRATHRARIAFAAACCDLIVAPDEGVARTLKKVLGWRPGLRVAPIPVGPSVVPLAAPVAPAPLPSSSLAVGYWGFQRADKGLLTLVKAFDRVRRARPARLILGGDPGPDATYIKHVARTAGLLGINNLIEQTGDLSATELSAFLRSLDVCVLPFRDGLASNRTTYVTTVAHGVFIVTTSLTRSGFDPITNTVFVRPGDVDAIADAILNPPSPRPNPGYADGFVTWDEIATQHIAAYAAVSKRSFK